MKKPKVEKINLPYASTVASFFGDQSGMQGNSFLGRLFKGGGGRSMVSRAQSKTTAAPAIPAKLVQYAPTTNAAGR
jgi:hypothetical protein